MPAIHTCCLSAIGAEDPQDGPRDTHVYDTELRQSLPSASPDRARDVDTGELASRRRPEEVWESGAGQPSAILPDDLPPGFIDPESFHTWPLYVDPTSGHDPWAGQIKTDTEQPYHRRPPALHPCTRFRTVFETSLPRHCLHERVGGGGAPRHGLHDCAGEWRATGRAAWCANGCRPRACQERDEQ